MSYSIQFCHSVTNDNIKIEALVRNIEETNTLVVLYTLQGQHEGLLTVSFGFLVPPQHNLTSLQLKKNP